MLPSENPMCKPVRPNHSNTQTKAETETKGMVPNTKELRVLRLWSVDKEELLYGAKPVLFIMLYD